MNNRINKLNKNSKSSNVSFSEANWRGRSLKEIDLFGLKILNLS